MDILKTAKEEGWSDFIIYLLFILTVAAKILGYILVLIMKMGAFGKLIMTALFCFIMTGYLYFVCSMLTQSAGVYSEEMEVLQWLVALGVSLLLAVIWFCPKHYGTLQNIPAGAFSSLFTILFIIGFVLYFVLGIFIGGQRSFFGIDNKYILELIQTSIPFVIVCLLWLKQTKPYYIVVGVSGTIFVTPDDD